MQRSKMIYYSHALYIIQYKLVYIYFAATAARIFILFIDVMFIIILIKHEQRFFFVFTST